MDWAVAGLGWTDIIHVIAPENSRLDVRRPAARLDEPRARSDAGTAGGHRAVDTLGSDRGAMEGTALGPISRPSHVF